MKTWPFSLLACGLLTACVASGPSQYVQEMSFYQGFNEAQLIAALGPPDKVYDIGDLRYLTYTKASQQTYPMGHTSYGYGLNRRGFDYSGSYGDMAVYTYRCDVFFALRQHRVTNIGHRGNAC